MTIEEVLAVEEMQVFDRKSVNIAPKVLAIPIIAFANADGGTVAIGISDKTRRIEGVDYDIQKLNELLRVPFDFCVPTVKVEIEKVQCIDFKGRENHVLLMHIEPSMEVHANQADEVFMRVGDKSKKLAFEERMQLMYDKGERFFEDKPVPETDIEDIDLAFVEKYIAQIGYSKTAMEYLRENKGFIKEKNGKVQISSAAILLFGKNPQLYFPRARVRFIRYEGTEERVGTQMNVIKDGTYTYSDMEDLINVCVKNMVTDNFTEEQARSYMKELLPKLDYWKRYDELSDHGEFEKFKKKLLKEINALHVEGLPEITRLNALVGKYVNLEYTLPNGRNVKFLDDQTTYLGTQSESEFEGDRYFGVLAGMDFILICTYEADRTSPELVLYKKR